MILDIYKDALEYSFQDGSRLLKLGIICFFNFLILPIFLQLGYSYRVTKIAVNGMINGREKLPDFNDAISMFIDGLKVFVVKFVYIIIPIIILAIFYVIAGLVGGYTSAAGSTIITIGAIVTIILGIIAYILSDLAICHMAAGDESLSSAFDFKGLFEIAKSIGWLRLIGFYIGLLLIMLVITLVVILVLALIFGIFGFITLGLGAGLAGVFGVGLIVMFAVFCFIVGPFLSILEARSIGLVYNLRD